MNPENRLSVGDVLNRVFALYKEHFGVLIPAAFWLFLVVSILAGIVGQHNLGLLLIVAVVSFAVAILYQGMVVSLVHDVQDGRRDSSVTELFNSVGPVLGPLIVASILYGLGVGIGFFLLIVPGCILLTIWAVIAPVIVIEKKGATDAFGRSRELVKGFGWPVFGTVLVAALLTAIASFILTGIAEAIAGGPILRIVFGALASTVTAPVGGLVAAVLYYRLLELKGGAAPPHPNDQFTSSEPPPPPSAPPPPPPPPPPPGPGAPA
jgi:MFS family permease